MLAQEVVLVDEDDALLDRARSNFVANGVANVKAVKGSIGEGYKDGAPYDVIFVNGSISVEPAALLAPACRWRQACRGRGISDALDEA